MKLSDRLWLWSNRKPQRPIVSYLQIVLLWTLYGCMVVVGLAVVTTVPEYWYIGVAIILCCFMMLFWFYWYDRKKGYVDAIHQRWLVQWLARKKRIEGEK